MVRADDLIKVHVGALGKIRIMPQGPAQPEQRRRVIVSQAGDRYRRVGDAGVAQLHIGAVVGDAAHLQPAVQPHMAGIIEPYAVEPFAHSPARHKTGGGLYPLRLAGQAVFIAVAADAPRAVAAHLTRGAVGVEEQHFIVAATGGGLHHHEAVCADGHTPLTQDADDLRPPVLGDGVPTVVHHDKIIACPVHLPEFHDSPPSRYFLPLYRELPPLSNTLSLSPAPKRKATL